MRNSPVITFSLRLSIIIGVGGGGGGSLAPPLATALICQLQRDSITKWQTTQP